MRKRILTVGLLLLVLALPALAVFKEQDLTQTLRVLLFELKQDYNRLSQRNNASESRITRQHNQLVSLVEESNELSLMLYSQPQDNTFDLTFALDQITRQYEDFVKNRMPFDDIINSMQVELERYSRLAQTLRHIPPERRVSSSVQQAVSVMDSIDVSIDTLLAVPSFAVNQGFELDSLGVVYRDSCLLLTESMIDHYYQRIAQIEEDSQYYAQTDEVLKEAYDYAQGRYMVVQKQVFLEGRHHYFYYLDNFSRYWRQARRDISSKYLEDSIIDTSGGSVSVWKGPIVWVYSFAMLLFLGLAILLGNLIVRLSMRWVPYFRTPYFREHKSLLVSLSGVIIFAAIVLVGLTGEEDVTFMHLASRMMGEFAALLGAILLSMLIRMQTSEQSHATTRAYLPTLSMAFLVIFLRIIFVPNSVLNLVFPPLLLLFAVWQLLKNIFGLKAVPREDRVLLWISCMVMIASTIISWVGLVMMSLLILVWWFFQLMLLQAITALFIILQRNYRKHMTKRQMEYRKQHPNLPLGSGKGVFIEISWLHDAMEMLVLPVLGIWSFPVAVILACKIFKINGVASELFFQPLINVEGVVHLSLFKLMIVLSLFFVFRYIIYAIKAFYRVWRTRAIIRKMEDPALFKESDVNYNLANNIISLAGWGIYVITAFVMLKIPTSALTIVTTGLATGIGFAMKDVLNNFFYGVQLMGGRVRVGDTIECDGIRGKVEGLSYQSTQVASEDGSIIAFTNTALFNKNFKNLTRNHQYEMINFTVGVKYGTDVEKARQVIRQALDPLLVKDKYGRDIVDMRKGIAIRLREFGDSSIDMQVLLYAAVEAHYSFAAAAKEAIYNAFNENGIEIPFPQRDVYIKETPAK